MAARLTTYVVVGIVAATFIAGLIVGAQRDDNDGPVDLIVHNARVFTADPSGTMAEAVAVRGNRVLRTGTNRDINRLRRPQTTVVDANGAAVLPGFNDSHVHFISGGLALEHIDLRTAATLDDVEERIRTWTARNADRPWVLGRGWTDGALPDGGSARQVLDVLVADRPALLLSSDGHTAWVNSRAMEMAGIAAGAEPPVNGTILRDSRGAPTGVLKGSAVELVAALVPQPSGADRARALRNAIDEAHKNGITSIQHTDGSEQDFQLYHEARKAGDLRVRVYSALPVSWPLDDEKLDRLEAIRKRYPDDPLFKTGALKIWVDGIAEPQAAWMLAPYAKRSGAAGEPAVAPDDLNRMVRLADARGWQVMTHASSDRAVGMALDAFEHAARSNLAPARGRRHRIEHAEAIDPSDVRRFGALRVLASMQPADAARLDMRTRLRSSDRTTRGWLHRNVASAGGRLVFGSDWPAASMNPLLGVHAAVTRLTSDAESEERRTPAERLTLAAALNAYTSSAAWASFDEQRKGTIAPGMLADMVVLSTDIFAAPASKLASATVTATIFDGKIVYRRDAPASTTE